MAAMTMKAAGMHEYGGPEVLVCEDAPRPEAGEGRILGVKTLDLKE